MKDVEFYDEIRTGSPSEILGTLKRSVAQYCRDDYDVTKMYIGKASGDAVKAMKWWYDDSKKREDLNCMIAIYEAKREEYSLEVERKLVAHFKSSGKCLNDKEGGGGRPSGGPKHYVYLALKTPYVRYYDDVITGQPTGILSDLETYVRKELRDYTEIMFIGRGSGFDALMPCNE